MNIIQNSAPEAHDFSVSTHKAYAGSFNVTDVNKDSLTYQIVSQPKHGHLTLNPNGTFTYTPNPGFKGEDAVTYMANDGLNKSNTANIKITVTNNPPQVKNLVVYINVTQNVTYTGKLTATDADGDQLTFTPYWSAINRDLTLKTDGTFAYTNRKSDVRCNFNGTPCADYILYQVSDGIDTERCGIVANYAI